MMKLSRQQQRFLLLIAFIIVGYFASHFEPEQAQTIPSTVDTNGVDSAFSQQLSDVQVHVSGTVIKLLADDNTGHRHQKFILQTASGLTLLVAHNIDLAPRISTLSQGDDLTLYGEYEWNAKGGILHWTHHDPAGRHVDGWIEHHGKRYQ